MPAKLPPCGSHRLNQPDRDVTVGGASGAGKERGGAVIRVQKRDLECNHEYIDQCIKYSSWCLLKLRFIFFYF